MPARRFMVSRRRMMSPINSIKISPVQLQAVATGANTTSAIAIATDTGLTSGQADVEKGCKIFRVWLEFSYSLTGTVTDGVSTLMDAYMWKNPGNNLTAPNPGSQGTSNEKKFIFKTWRGLCGARSQGVAPYTWKGWIKIPKVYQRMGVDDRLEIITRAVGVAGVVCIGAVLKYYK